MGSLFKWYCNFILDDMINALQEQNTCILKLYLLTYVHRLFIMEVYTKCHSLLGYTF